jgi:hypothetical protein
MLLGLPTAGTAGGPSEGIKVHGHWTIEIRRPDGSLVSHSEFENSLTTEGMIALSKLMWGDSVTTWQILLDDGTQSGPCESASGPTYCVMSIPVDRAYQPDGLLEIKGVSTAATDSVVGSVSTVVRAVSGSDGRHRTYFFSSRNLVDTEKRPVLKDQIIQVTVVFTFS